MADTIRRDSVIRALNEVHAGAHGGYSLAKRVVWACDSFKLNTTEREILCNAVHLGASEFDAERALTPTIK